MIYEWFTSIVKSYQTSEFLSVSNVMRCFSLCSDMLSYFPVVCGNET